MQLQKGEIAFFMSLFVWLLSNSGLSAPDPHEDDARGHVPSADSTGATCLHLNAHFSLCSALHSVSLYYCPSIFQLF